MRRDDPRHGAYRDMTAARHCAGIQGPSEQRGDRSRDRDNNADDQAPHSGAFFGYVMQNSPASNLAGFWQSQASTRPGLPLLP
jgi:hypothetical protein